MSKIAKDGSVFYTELFLWRGFKLPKTIYRKMGAHVYALFHPDKSLIEIDERLRGKKLLEIHIHEVSHWIHPDLSEDEIRKCSRKMTEYLWREGYRKIDS